MIKKLPFQTGGLIALILVSLIIVAQLAKQNRYISELVEHGKDFAVGDKAYTFSAIDLTGQQIDTKAANVVLIFFSTTCESCVETIDSWKKLYENYSTKGIKVIGISADPRERTKQFVKKYGLPFSILSDADHTIGWKYRVRYVPLIVLVDHEGKIRFYRKRGQPMDEVLSLIEQRVHELI